MLRASPLPLREAKKRNKLISLGEMERNEGNQNSKNICFSKRLLYRVCEFHVPLRFQPSPLRALQMVNECVKNDS